jgi:hypothetical protein
MPPGKATKRPRAETAAGGGNAARQTKAPRVLPSSSSLPSTVPGSSSSGQPSGSGSGYGYGSASSVVPQTSSQIGAYEASQRAAWQRPDQHVGGGGGRVYESTQDEMEIIDLTQSDDGPVREIYGTLGMSSRSLSLPKSFQAWELSTRYAELLLSADLGTPEA